MDSCKKGGGDVYAHLRSEMVKKQIVNRGIKDEKVIEAMGTVPRHMFVEEIFIDKAYGDFPLPIGGKQTISQPYMVALMVEMLELASTDKVLEIGTGSGYQAAVLSRLAEQVYSVERVPALSMNARKIMESFGYHNVALNIADGTLGWKDYAPYNAIVVAAGGLEVPKCLVDQLAVGGRLVIPVGDGEKQVLHKLVKTRLTVRKTVHTTCTFVKLIGRHGWQETAVK
ncbi:MAG: protein-L-isoaspartate O-methyltransferase [bacterium]|nr:MAG: protein-L-isoaspartate O-methyltransferase [bacterium]